MPSKWCSASHSISIPSSSQSRASRRVSWMIRPSWAGSMAAGKRKLLNFIVGLGSALDLDPGPAPDAPRQPGGEVGQPELPAVLGPHRGVRPLDRDGVGDDVGGHISPVTLDIAAHVGGRNARARGMPESLELPRVCRAE